MVEKEVYDLIIIGSGPAGITAAIYAQRAMLKTLTIEKQYMSGGQVLNTYEVDNYPGLQGINGFDMGEKFKEHCIKLGAKFVKDEVIEINRENNYKVVKCNKSSYKTKTVIICTGASYRMLGIEGEKEFYGKGVSYCATCDGAFYKDKIVAVVGGGDVALEDAIFLSRLCKRVYLIHRRDTFRGAKIYQDKVFKIDNIEILWDTVVEKINGEKEIESIDVKNVKNLNIDTINLSGVFIAIGVIPNSKIFENIVNLDENGYIISDEDGITSSNGIFVAGDVRTKKLRQIITACSDGANAVSSVENYLTLNF